jgi:hypothetical protein
MEDVLDLNEEEYDPRYPTVCLDEKPVVLHADVHPSLSVERGQPKRVDYEYERRGTRNLFVMVEHWQAGGMSKSQDNVPCRTTQR